MDCVWKNVTVMLHHGTNKGEMDETNIVAPMILK
jgi:hypothetical protein